MHKCNIVTYFVIDVDCFTYSYLPVCAEICSKHLDNIAKADECRLCLQNGSELRFEYMLLVSIVTITQQLGNGPTGLCVSSAEKLLMLSQRNRLFQISLVLLPSVCLNIPLRYRFALHLKTDLHSWLTLRETITLFMPEN